MVVFSIMIIFYDVVCNINLLSLLKWGITLKENMIIFYIFFGLSSPIFISVIFVCKSLNGEQPITRCHPHDSVSLCFHQTNEFFDGGGLLLTTLVKNNKFSIWRD